LREQLAEMTESKLYNTRSTYSTLDTEGLSFIEKHMNYMSQYKNIDCHQYLSNLKLKTKIR
jgi:hypothetical protein